MFETINDIECLEKNKHWLG